MRPVNGLKVVSEPVDGDRSTLTVRGETSGLEATGTIGMVREEGRWKVLGERWDLGPGADTRSEVPAGASLHDAARAGDAAAVAARLGWRLAWLPTPGVM